METLELNGVPVTDTFAEAFDIVAARLIVTAANDSWAQIASQEFCGFATSVIACSAEAAPERVLGPDETPDGRPGVSLMIFGFSKDGLATAIADRVGQCILTCPTTACYDGLPDVDQSNRVALGKQLRYFGDGHQISKKLGDQRFWRIPVMDGEFVCEDKVGTQKGIAGGNLLIGGRNQSTALAAAEEAVAAMNEVNGVALPFPGGIVRSGSKVGSVYKTLKASTNDAYCPTLRAQTKTSLNADTEAVYEIVIDGLSFEAIQAAMKVGLHAAAACPDVTMITAGNYGGKLGKHHFHLRDIV